MNIFYLDKDARVSARAMTNKHIVKMILESAQLLSTAHHVLDGVKALSMNIYKATHRNHPSAIWVRESAYNYKWLYEHLAELLNEYARRYHKRPTDHKTFAVFARLYAPPLNIPRIAPTPMRCAITNKEYMVKGDAVASYRNYYVAEKLKNAEDIERFKKVLKS